MRANSIQASHVCPPGSKKIPWSPNVEVGARFSGVSEQNNDGSMNCAAGLTWQHPSESELHGGIIMRKPQAVVRVNNQLSDGNARLNSPRGRLMKFYVGNVGAAF